MKRLSCPICKRMTCWEGNPYRPFCSKRCKLMDLAAWIGEEYSIRGESVDTSFHEANEPTPGISEERKI